MITTRGTPSSHKMIPRMTGFLAGGKNKSGEKKNPVKGFLPMSAGNGLPGEGGDARRSSLKVEPTPRVEVPFPTEG